MEKQQVSHTLFGSPVALDCSTEIPGNVSVPKSNIQIKIRVGPGEQTSPVFVLLTDSLIMLLQNH